MLETNVVQGYEIVRESTFLKNVVNDVPFENDIFYLKSKLFENIISHFISPNLHIDNSLMLA